MDTIIEKIIDMTIESDDEDVFIIINERDREYAVQNNLKIAYSDLDLEDSSLQETLQSVPDRKNRLCPEGRGCASREVCAFIHNLNDLVLFPCRDQHLCPHVAYHPNGYFINVGSGCFNVHGNEKRKDFFIRNGLVRQLPTFVDPVKLEGVAYHKRTDEEKGIMFRPRRIVAKPDEKVVKTLICQSIKKQIKCKFGNECTFAHKYSELKVIPCKSTSCMKYRGDEPCPYKHRDETLLQFALRNKCHTYFPDEVQPPVPGMQIETQSKFKTRLCANMNNCRFGSRCNFAHSLQELRK